MSLALRPLHFSFAPENLEIPLAIPLALLAAKLMKAAFKLQAYREVWQRAQTTSLGVYSSSLISVEQPGRIHYPEEIVFRLQREECCI